LHRVAGDVHDDSKHRTQTTAQARREELRDRATIHGRDVIRAT
jgi:hypothetical protein